MKKLLCILLMLTLCLSLASCGGRDSSSEKEASSEEVTAQADVTEVSDGVMELNKEIVIEDYAKITLKSISTKDAVAASMGSTFVYKVDDDSNSYADAIFDIEYLGSAEVSCTEFMTATATGKNDMVFEDVLYCVELDNMTRISAYESIKPLSSVRFHAAFEIPKTESDLVLAFDINGQDFTFNYTLGEYVNDAIELNDGDSVDDTDYAKMEFVGVEFTEKLLPPNTDGLYTYFSTSSDENIYIAIKYDITNYMAEAKEAYSFTGITATFDGNYTYTGFPVIEDNDEKGFSRYASIESLSTRKLVYLIEVPKTVTGMDFDLNILFNKSDYVYKGTATFDAE